MYFAQVTTMDNKSVDNDIQTEMEKKPLLNGSLPVKSVSTVPPNVSKRRFLIGPLLLLQVFSYVIQQLTLVQYSYFAFTKMYFPNETANLTVIKQESTCVNSTESEREDQAKIQTLASNFNIYVTVALGIPNIFSNLLIGSYSDVYGRKMFISIALCGQFVKGLLLTIAIYFEINIYIFVIFSVIDGCTGSIMGTITAMLAFTADCTVPGRQRVISITILEMMLGLGALLASLSSGYLINSTGYVTPNLVVTATLGAVAITAIACLPETLHEKNTRPKTSIRQKLNDIVAFYVLETEHRIVYIICIVVVLCVGLCNQGRSNVETLYQLNAPFCWDSVLIGWYLAIRLAAQTIIGVMLLRLCMCCIGDELLGMFGAFSSAASFIMEAFATTSPQLILGK